jgi:hypothetical protein
MRTFSGSKAQLIKGRQRVLFPIKRTVPAGTYSDAQWRAIEAALARIGVDLKVIVTPGWSALSQPLHQVLQNLSHAFAELRAAPRSWRPLIEDMRQATAALEAAHAIFARYLDTDVEAIDAELMPVIAKTRQRLDRLLEKGDRVPTPAKCTSTTGPGSRGCGRQS